MKASINLIYIHHFNCSVKVGFLCALIQAENGCLHEQISAMNKELEITKEKLNTLEQAWENICVTGMDLNDHRFRISC